MSGLPLTLRTPECTQGKFYDCCTDPLLSVSCPSPAPRNNNHGITGAGCSSSSYISQSAHHHSASNHLESLCGDEVRLPTADIYIRAEGFKLFLDFHHFACFIQCTYVCRFRKSLYGITSFTQKSENPLQKVSDLL